LNECRELAIGGFSQQLLKSGDMVCGIAPSSWLRCSDAEV
jgi:hypothetical protein